jgi:hypothetical protein
MFTGPHTDLKPRRSLEIRRVSGGVDACRDVHWPGHSRKVDPIVSREDIAIRRHIYVLAGCSIACDIPVLGTGIEVSTVIMREGDRTDSEWRR